MYIIVSSATLRDPEKELFETHIGLDDLQKTLLLSCWGKTEKESKMLADGVIKRLSFILPGAEIPEQLRQYPFTEAECQPIDAKFFWEQLAQLSKIAGETGMKELQAILIGLAGVVQANDVPFFFDQTREIMKAMAQRTLQNIVDYRSKLN